VPDVPGHSSRPVLLYDTGCRLCRFAARVADAIDRKDELAFLGLADAEADGLLGRIPEEEQLSSVRLVRPDGHLLSGGDAVLALLREMEGTQTLSRAIEAIRGEGAVDRLYELVSRHRNRLGRLVPDGPAPRRFP
jgi:predicted DCC family thiol-disulfide oxidoreductase YuxK